MTDEAMPPGVQCLRANNPSPMTGTGTNTYILRDGDDCLILDPGPDLPSHLAALTDAVAGIRLNGIIVTHAHLDHSQSAPALGQAMGVPTLAFGGATSGRSPVMERLAAAGLHAGPEGLDLAFRPDIALTDDQTIPLGTGEVRVLHTPGHLGGHICLEWRDLLFCGDHIMAWSSSLVSPPDGDMAAYMESLRRLRGLNRWRLMLPGHGPVVTKPGERLDALIAHRKAREAAIITALGQGSQTAEDLTAKIYADTSSHLMPAACRNVLAHLIALWQANLVTCAEPLTENSAFSLRGLA